MKKNFYCRGCRKSLKRIKLCPQCKRCVRCGCQCTYCRYCNRSHSNSVSRCKVCGCKKVCKCRGMAHFEPDKNLSKFKVSPPGMALWWTGARLNTLPIVTWELEASRWGDMIYDQFKSFGFTTHGDSSVTSGVEMVIPAIKGDNLINVAVEVGAVAELHRVRVDDTCGFHVHVDVRGRSVWQIAHIVKLYLAVERELYALCTPQRVNCRYARPFTLINKRVKEFLENTPTTTHEVKRELIKLVYGLDINNFTRDWRSWLEIKSAKPPNINANPDHPRYMGFNVFSFFYRGTLEFRMKEGTFNPVELIGWSVLCMALVERSDKMIKEDLVSARLAPKKFLMNLHPIVKDYIEWKEKN